MNPARRIVEIPLSGGMDQKTRAELVDPGASLLTLSNVVQLKRGTHQKRYGSASLGVTRADGTSRTAGRKILPYKDTHAVIDGHLIDTYSSVAARYASRDRVPECVAQRIHSMQTGGLDFGNANDIAYVNGYYVVLYGAYTDVAANTKATFGVVIDATTGAIVRGPEDLIDPTNKTMLASAGGYVFLLSSTSGGANITAYRMQMTAAGIQTGWGLGSNIITDANTLLYWDCHSLSDRFAVAYVNNSGGSNTVTLKTFNTTPTQIASLNVAAGVGCDAVCVSGHTDTSDVIWLGFADSGGANVKVGGYDAVALSTTYAFGTIITGSVTRLRVLGIARTGAGTGKLVASQGGPTTQDPSLYYRNFHGSGAAMVADGNTTRIRRCVAETRPWTVDSRVYVLTRLASTNATPTADPALLVTLDVTDESTTGRPVANIAPRLQPTGLALRTWTPMHVAAVSSSQVAALGTTRRSGSTGALDVILQDFGHANRWQGAEAADALHLSGGVPTVFDGQRACEIGFIPKPEISSIAASGTGVTGTFLFVAVYEQVDSRGQRHVSEPSTPVTSNAITNKTLTVNVSTLQVTARQDTGDSTNPVQIVLYGTDNAGSTYYRIAAAKNDPSVDTVAFTINSVTWLSNALLYTQPGTAGTSQSRAAPPSFLSLVTHGDRLFGVGDDGISVWPSFKHVIGEGMAFADLFQFPIEKGGTIVGLASQDGRLVAFKRSSIWVVDGDGPSDNGAAGEFSLPIQVPTGLGCTQPRSICTTPIGTVFGSQAGIQLLTRSLEVKPIGDPVEDTLAQFPIITSAACDEAKNIVVFTCVATEDPITGAGTSGRMLVWNYNFGDWTVYDMSSDSGATSAAGACVASSGSSLLLHWVTPGGIVVREDSTTYLDRGAAYVSQQFETAWLKVAGLQGFQKLRRITVLAAKQTNHDLKLELAFDYESSFTETKTWTASAINALPREQLQYGLKRRRCMAIKIRVTCQTPSGGLAVGTGQGPVLLGLALEALVKPGIARLGASAKA